MYTFKGEKMLTLCDFVEAKERLSNVLVKTKLIYSSTFSKEFGNTVYIKPENLQRTGSFKIRGAYNKIFMLSEDEKKKGLIASSAGNHAQGVAFAAQKLGVKATIVMPKHTPLIKVEATARFGAEVVLHGEVYDEAYKKAKELQEEKGYIFVHPFDDDAVIAGQGTIALEILKELPDVDIIMVPLGGGGLISGIAAAAKLKNPEIKIIGVEPEGAASAIKSLNEGKVTELSESYTIADGAAVKRIGDTTFEYIKKYVDEIITAGLRNIKEKDKKIVSVLSGGNIDVLTISSMISKGLISRGRIFSFSVQLPDKPGQLQMVSDILTRLNANVIKLDHNQFKNLDRFHEVELQVTVETNGEEHIQKIIKEFKNFGYEILRINI